MRLLRCELQASGRSSQVYPRTGASLTFLNARAMNQIQHERTGPPGLRAAIEPFLGRDELRFAQKQVRISIGVSPQ